MADSESLIEELSQRLEHPGWTDTVSTWLDTNVFTIDTGIELAIIVAAASIAWPIAVYLGKRITQSARETRYAILTRLWRRVDELIFPLSWLAVQLLFMLAAAQFEIRDATVVITTSLLSAWIIVQLATAFVPHPFWAKTIAAVVWLIAALNIVGWLDYAIRLLADLSVTVGQVSVSALAVIQGLIALGVLLWITTIGAQVIEDRIKRSPSITPSIQVLATKLIRIGFAAFAFLMALAIVGVDLTAFAVVGGAVGVGLGFGLQKIFSNLVSGFILLLDKSIKPGDVIAVADYFGRVDSLGARYVSVMTRDGVEHLIPNEELIITRVENWSHSNNLLRLRKLVGVHYKADVHKAIELCLEAANETARILSDPKPNCLMRDYGESSVDLEMRFWINDPMNGRANVTSELLLRIWDKFHDHGIEIPYPQRDLHLRSSDIGNLSADFLATRQAS